MANPKAEVEITASSRSLGAKLREARAKFASFGVELKKNVFGKDLIEKGFWGKAGAQMVGNLGSRAAGSALGFIAQQAKDAYAFQEQLDRFQIATRKTRVEAGAFGQAARQISSETGLAAGSILRMGRAYADIAGAQAVSVDMMRTIAQAAQASGTDLNDLTSIVYALHNSFKIPDSEIEATLSGLINQSKDGTVHFNKLAQEVIGVAPDFVRFGLAGREGANQLTAMFQVVRGGSKDVSEASTKLESFMRGLQRHEKNFKKYGIKLTDVDANGVKHWRRISDIINEIQHSKLGKDAGKLMTALGRGEGESAYNLLSKNLDKLREFEQAAEDSGTVQKDLATYTTSASGRIAIAWEKAKNKIAAAFTTDRIQTFAKALEETIAIASKLAIVVDKVASGWAQIADADNISKDDDETASITTQDLYNTSRKNKAKADQEALDIIKNPHGATAKMQAENLRSNPQASDYNAVGRGAIAYAKANGLYNEFSITGTKGAPSKADTAALVDVVQKTVGAMHNPLINAIKDLTAELRSQSKKPVTVKVGNDAIVRADRSAPSHRSRPGP